MRELVIAGRRIADDEPTYLIAEAGCNHGGSPHVALEMVEMAAACGADACKFQKRDNATLYTADMLNQLYAGPHSYGSTYGEHRAALELDAPVYCDLIQRGAYAGIHVFATAFDERSADTLIELGVPALKLASGSLTDLPLLRHVSILGKPVILSTGGGTLEDIDHAVNILIGRVPFALLHCVAAYPVRDWRELNLRCILTLRQRYSQTVIGWSGHDTLEDDSGACNALLAYAFGARIIEKHVTHSHKAKGTDHVFSLEPAGLRKLVRDIRRAEAACGDGIKRYLESERGPISKMRRRHTQNGWVITGELDVLPSLAGSDDLNRDRRHAV